LPFSGFNFFYRIGGMMNDDDDDDWLKIIASAVSVRVFQ
jgi:hypothetical protein